MATQSTAAGPTLPKFMVFERKDSLTTPGMSLPQFKRGTNDVVSLRIYKGKAILAPGAEYKSVVAHAGSTARKVIQRALKRFDDSSNPEDFRLQYVKASDADKKIRGVSGLLQRRSTGTLVLSMDEMPVLVAERHSNRNAEGRRFELVRVKFSKTATAAKQLSNEDLDATLLSPSGCGFPAVEADNQRVPAEAASPTPEPPSVAPPCSTDAESDTRSESSASQSQYSRDGSSSGKTAASTAAAAAAATATKATEHFQSRRSTCIETLLPAETVTPRRNSYVEATQLHPVSMVIPAPLMEKPAAGPRLAFKAGPRMGVRGLGTGTNLLGSDPSRADLLFAAADGIDPIHCEIHVADGKVAVAPYPNAVVFVEGNRTTRPLMLPRAAGLVLGQPQKVELVVSGGEASLKKPRPLSAEELMAFFPWHVAATTLHTADDQANASYMMSQFNSLDVSQLGAAAPTAYAASDISIRSLASSPYRPGEHQHHHQQRAVGIVQTAELEVDVNPFQDTIVEEAAEVAPPVPTTDLPVSPFSTTVAAEPAQPQPVTAEDVAPDLAEVAAESLPSSTPEVAFEASAVATPEVPATSCTPTEEPYDVFHHPLAAAAVAAAVDHSRQDFAFFDDSLMPDTAPSSMHTSRIFLEAPTAAVVPETEEAFGDTLSATSDFEYLEADDMHHMLLPAAEAIAGELVQQAVFDAVQYMAWLSEPPSTPAAIANCSSLESSPAGADCSSVAHSVNTTLHLEWDNQQNWSAASVKLPSGSDGSLLLASTPKKSATPIKSLVETLMTPPKMSSPLASAVAAPMPPPAPAADFADVVEAVATSVVAAALSAVPGAKNPVRSRSQSPRSRTVSKTPRSGSALSRTTTTASSPNLSNKTARKHNNKPLPKPRARTSTITSVRSRSPTTNSGGGGAGVAAVKRGSAEARSSSSSPLAGAVATVVVEEAKAERKRTPPPVAPRPPKAKEPSTVPAELARQTSNPALARTALARRRSGNLGVDQSSALSKAGLRPTGRDLTDSTNTNHGQPPRGRSASQAVPSVVDMGLRPTGVDLSKSGEPTTRRASQPLPTFKDMGLRPTGRDLSKLGTKAAAKTAQPPTPSVQDLGLRATGVSLRELELKRQQALAKPASSSPGGVKIERLTFSERLKVFEQK